jgi:hypothetical protein
MVDIILGIDTEITMVVAGVITDNIKDNVKEVVEVHMDIIKGDL